MSNRIINGVKWSGIERFSVQIIQFIITIILARILTPTDFGLVAITTIFLTILQTINEAGFGVALIQKQNRDNLDYDTVFTLNVLMGIILYISIYFIAPIIQHFFNYSNLSILLRWTGLNLIITSFVVVQRTILTINVDFKTQAKCSLIAIVISGGVGILTAYRGFGVMALIWQSLINNFLNVFFIWIWSKWRPSFLFSISRLKSLFDFAYKLILARMVNSIFSQLYSFVIGKFFTPADLGLYNRASSFESLSTNNITQIVQRVSTPILCEKQNNYKELETSLFLFIKNTAFVVFPLLFILIFLARPIVLVILTDKWEGVIPLMPYVCTTGFFFVISTFNINVFNATGRTGLALKSEIIKKIIYVAILAICIPFGFMWLIRSLVIISFLESLISVIYTKIQLGTSIMSQLNNVLPILLISGISGGIGSLCIFLIQNILIKLICGILIISLIYIGLSYLFNVNNSKYLFKRCIKI